MSASDIIQVAVVTLAVAAAVVYVVIRVIRRMSRPKDCPTDNRSGCGGCDADCPLRR